MLSIIVAASLPIGPSHGSAVPSVSGDGVYFTDDGQEFYEFSCSSSCSWTKMEQTLPNPNTDPIIMPFPGYKC